MKMTNTGKFQQGLTMVELMVAMVLGLVLVGGVIQIYISNKQTYRVQESQSRVQENVRYSLEFLTKDIREAGYSGCRKAEEMNIQVIASPPVSVFNNSLSVTGHEAGSGSWTPALPASISGTVVSGTDVVTIQKGSSCGATLTGNLLPSNANIQVSAPNSCNLTPDDVLIISDCTDAHLFRATSVSPGTGTETVTHTIGTGPKNQANHFCTSYPSDIGTTTYSGVCSSFGAVGKTYSYDSEIVKFSSLTYYVRSGAGGRNALWVYDNAKAAGGDNPMELVEGVEDLQIRYGRDTDGDDVVDVYDTANTVDAATAWDEVISAELTLLLETQDANLTTAAQSLTYNGGGAMKTVTGADGRLRRVFSTVVNVRNRVQ